MARRPFLGTTLELKGSKVRTGESKTPRLQDQPMFKQALYQTLHILPTIQAPATVFRCSISLSYKVISQEESRIKNQVTVPEVCFMAELKPNGLATGLNASPWAS